MEQYTPLSEDDSASRFEWGPEELDALERLYASVDDPGQPSASSPTPLMRCLRCNTIAQQQSIVPGSVCASCGFGSFYNVAEPTRQATWLYVPRVDSAPAGPVLSPSARRPAVETRQGGHGGPPDPPPARETGESEDPTDDPSVVAPSSTYSWPNVVESERQSTTSSRRRRRRNRSVVDPQPPQPDVASPRAPSAAGSNVERPSPSRLPMPSRLPGPTVGTAAKSSNELLEVMRQLLDEKRGSDRASQGSWDSRRGPIPGVKWKGGTPPAPPRWSYNSSDLRAFSKWERRVQVWRLQVQNQLTGAEAGLICQFDWRS